LSSHPLILISCGGTGGHLLPGIALGEHIAKNKNLSVLFLVSDKKITPFFTTQMKSEHQILPEVKYQELKSFYFWRPLWGLLFSFVFLMHLFLTRSISGTISAGGGAGTLPILLSYIFRIPRALLEQNVIVGQANRILLPFVETVYLSLPSTHKDPLKKFKCLGNPLRESLTRSQNNRSQAAENLGLSPDTFTLLIFGGSQGAKKLNEWALQCMEHLSSRKKNFQLIHLTGNKLFSECRTLYKKLDLKFYCEAFCEDMASVYTLSHFCISRAGGGAIAELNLFHIPTIYVPFPFAAEEHQKANAAFAEQYGMGWMMEEETLFSDSGKEKFFTLLEDTEAQEQCRTHQKKHASPNAALEIADHFLMG
jgi:UDP-N-acetylglucosamine--N-acetylmuramyl-(pentapeptide) pyrophosphoryl-undecaprenol N-acetylglucosamine transferase